jgi:hypothetical protein
MPQAARGIAYGFEIARPAFEFENATPPHRRAEKVASDRPRTRIVFVLG